MKMRISVLIVSIVLTQNFSVKADQEKGQEQERKNFLQGFIDKEEKLLGAKNPFGYYGAKSYVDYCRAKIAGDEQEAAYHWETIQKINQKIAETQTPVTFYGMKGLFGYWLYRKIAYPEGRVNWGIFKRNIACIAIPALLFKEELTKCIEGVKENSKLVDEQQRIITEQNSAMKLMEKVIEDMRIKNAVQEEVLNRGRAMWESEKKLKEEPVCVEVSQSSISAEEEGPTEEDDLSHEVPVVIGVVDEAAQHPMQKSFKEWFFGVLGRK